MSTKSRLQSLVSCIYSFNREEIKIALEKIIADINGGCGCGKVAVNDNKS